MQRWPANKLTNPHRQPRGPSPCARVEESSLKWFVTNKVSCTPHTVNNNTTTDKYLGIYTDLVIPLHFLLKTADQIVGCHHKSRVIFSRQKWPLRTTLVFSFFFKYIYVYINVQTLFHHLALLKHTYILS